VCNINDAKLALMNLHNDDWLDKLRLISQMRNHLQFKASYQLENYVNMDLKKQEQSIMVQLRCDILPLRIEAGRYKEEQIHEINSIFCYSGSVEDKIHFMINCPCCDVMRNLVLIKTSG